MRYVIALALASLCLAAPAWADTCLSQSGVETYTAGQPVPQACDLHGSQKVMLVDENGDPTSASGTSVTVEEEDADPSVTASTLKFTNGTVTDNGDGSVSVTTGGGDLSSTDIDTSAELGTILGDETGSGVVVFGTAPTISSAVLSTKVNLPRVTAFPGTPSAGDTVIVTDDSSAGACDSDAGAVTSLCQYNGSAWVPLGDGGAAEADTPDTIFARSKSFTQANSLANALRIGDGTTPWCIYTDASAGPIITPCTDANVTTRIPANFTWCLYDAEAASCAETFDPDNATQAGKWAYSTAYRPLKSIWFGAGSLYGDGTQCPADPTAATINSGPKIPTFICTDNDAATLYGSVKMPDSWDGGTVTFEHSYIQTAADTGVLNGDIAAQCHGNGETVDSTWGTEVAIDDAAVTGSSKNDFTTSAAVTPAGTCAAGDMLYFRYQLDAGGTTTAVSTLHHVGFKMEYSITSRSD